MLLRRALLAALLPPLLSGCPAEKTPAPGAGQPGMPAPTQTAEAAPPTTVTALAPPSTASPPVPSASAPPASSGAAPRALTAIHVPSSVGAERRPFVLLLHGLGASGKVLETAIGLPAFAEERRFVWAAPDGAMNGKGQRFWNASKACCNFENSPVDHVAELRKTLDEATALPSVDPKRVWVVGISNGAFMAQRLACEVDGLAGVVSISGSGPAEGERCAPRAPVAVIEVHGDADAIIRYNGGQALGRPDVARHPSALETVTGWAVRDHCGPKPEAGGTMDLDDKLDGAETSVLKFPGCARPVELWTVHGGSHYLATEKKMDEAIIDYIDKHPRP